LSGETIKVVVNRKIIKVLLLILLGWLVVAWIAAKALVVDADLPHADAIVVLSGASTYRERTHKAAELYNQGRAPLVVLTDDNTRGGWSSAQQRNLYFVERAHQELVKQGVPPTQIRVAPGVADGTSAEASIIKDYAAAHGLRSVLVVTSAYHSRRALRTLRRAFAGTGTTIGLTTAPTGWQTPAPPLWWLHLEGWRSVGGEYVKLIYYWLKFG
jgi:uncharacterized SAM-binding protein YcdF (DUF218 family)